MQPQLGGNDSPSSPLTKQASRAPLPSLFSLLRLRGGPAMAFSSSTYGGGFGERGNMRVAVSR